MNYKKFTAKVDEETGKIAGFFSTYDKQPDSYGDIIETGAFTKTITDRGGENPKRCHFYLFRLK